MRYSRDILSCWATRTHMKRNEFIKYEIAMHATIYHMMNETAINDRGTRIATAQKLHTTYSWWAFTLFYTLRIELSDCFILPHRIVWVSDFLVCSFLCSFEMSIWRRTIWATTCQKYGKFSNWWRNVVNSTLSMKWMIILSRIYDNANWQNQPDGEQQQTGNKENQIWKMNFCCCCCCCCKKSIGYDSGKRSQAKPMYRIFNVALNNHPHPYPEWSTSPFDRSLSL